MKQSLVVQRGLCNAMKLWTVLCEATQDRWAVANSADKISTGGYHGNPVQYSCLENLQTLWKGKKNMTLQDEAPRLDHQAPLSMEFSRQEWVSIPFSKGSSQPRNQTWISCIAGRFFTVWATRETLLGKSGGQLLIAPERMKWLGQSRKDAELWMCTKVKVKSDAIKKNNITQEPWKLGPWIKVNWM